MAEWRKATAADLAGLKEEDQQYGDGKFVLPVPQDPEFNQLQESLFNEVKAELKADPDPRFARLRWGPAGGAGEGEAALPAGEWRTLERPPMQERPPEEPGIWDRLIDWTSRSVIEQVAGGAREMGQRFAFEGATEKGEELRRVRALEGKPEGEVAYFGATSLKDIFTNPWKAMDLPGNLVKMGLSSTEEGREVLEQKLLEEMQEKLDKAKSYGEGAEMRPFSPVTQQFLNPESENTAWEDFMADPVTIVAELGMRSLPNMAPGMAMGVAGGAAAGLPGFAAGMGAGSARVEYASTILGELQQIQGIDIYNAEDLYKVLSDVDLMDEIHQKAVTRASRIGSLDAAAGVLGGTVLVRKLGGPVVTKLTEATAQMGSQGALGGLGEALAMEATGEAESVAAAFGTRDVLAEIAGEGVTAPIDVAAATISGAREARAGKTIPIPETDIDPDTGKPVIRETPDVEPGADVLAETKAPAFDVPEEGFSDAEREALEGALDQQAEPQQGTLDLPPQEGQAAPPTPTTPEPAPTPPAGETLPDAADQPTAEPVGDIQAQLNDMVEGNRDAVYLSPEQQVAPDVLPEGAVPLPNFDGKGGTLIAKNEGVAAGATAAREAGVSMQEIIGSLTKAGVGKPAAGGPVVQLRDAEGNVARETMAATQEEAETIAAEWGEGATILSPQEVLARREGKIAEETIESPMIDKKEVETGFRALNKRTKEGMKGLRKAVRELGTAIQAVFPEAKLPSLKNRIGPKRMGEFFAALDEEVVIDEVLPNLKEFLRAVVDAKSTAEAVQNLNRLKDYVANSGAGVVTQGAEVELVQQAAQGITAYESFEARREAGKKTYTATDKKTGKKVKKTTNRSPENKPQARAVAIDELATVVESLVAEANEFGIPVAPEVNETIRRARKYREWSQTPTTRISKGGAGSKQTEFKFNRKNLDEVGGKLRQFATELVNKVAERQAKLPKKPKGKPKVEAKKPVTEAPAKPKKAEAAKKVSKAKAEKKAAPEKPATKREQSPALKAYNDLRARAKELGVKATGKKEELAARVAKAEQERGGKQVPVTTKKQKTSEAKIVKAQKEVKKGMDVKSMLKQPETEVEIETAGPALSGKQGAKFGEEMGVEGGEGVVARALEAAGIPESTAKLIRGIMKKTDAAGRKKITKALEEYTGNKDRLSFIAAIYEALGSKLADNQMQELLDFAESKAAKQAADPTREQSVSDEMLAEQAAANGMTLEDYKTLLEETGQYTEEQAEAESPWSDEFHDMSADEFENSQWSLADKQPKGAVESGEQLARALINPKNGFLGFIYKFTKKRGQPNPGPTNVNDILEAIIDSLPPNNRYVPLARRLLQLDLDVPVYIYEEGFEVNGQKALGGYYPGNQYDPSTRKIRLYAGESQDPRHLFATTLHEVVHAATIAGYETDAGFRYEIDGLYDKAVAEMDKQDPGWRQRAEESGYTQANYGLKDAKEFMSEALTNPKFQQWLAGIPSDSRIRTNTQLGQLMSGLMRSFINAIKKYLGYSIRNSVLEDVLVLVDANLQTEEEVLIAQQKLQVQARRARESAAAAPPPQETSRNDILDAQRALPNSVKDAAKSKAKVAKDLAARGNLGFSNLDVMERNNRSLFDRAAAAINKVNPLTLYTKAKNSASALARKYEKQAYQLLKKLQKVDNKARSVMEVIMRDVTLANIDPTQPLNSEANKHIWTKGGKNTPPRISKKYADIAPVARQRYLDFAKSNPKEAALLGEMAKLTKDIHNTKVRSALFALGEMFELPRSMISALQAATSAEDVDKIISPNAVEVLTEKLEGADEDTTKALKKLIAQAEAYAEVAKSAKKIIYESSIKGWYFPLRRYGDFVVSTGEDVTGTDRYVSFHSTEVEAKKVAAALNEKFPDNPVNVSLKIEKAAASADVKSVIGDLGRRFRGKDNEATRNRLKAAMAEILAANAAYQSQLTRQNVDGVAAADMARGFEEYVHVSKYTIGDLLVAHKIADAINDMNALQANAETTDDQRIQIGRVVNEIKTRNIMDANDRTMSKVQRVVGLIGFLNYLGAPSYWILNATQTYTVTLPYIIAKYGVRAPDTLARAQGSVLAAATKAVNSKDKSYEGFKAQLTAEQRRVVETLEAENVIQSTIAHEFGDMLSPNTLNNIRKHSLGKPVARTMDMASTVMEKVPEAVEHFNRISTALAVYELSKGDMTATVDAVQATQFNYDSANRARLLKELPGAGGGRAIITPIMMFKTYGIGIMRLLYGGMIDVVYKEGGRLEAAKLVAGLITSHTVFGGVAGGIAAAPVMMLQALANSIFKEAGDEWDLEEAVEEWAREIGGDMFATAARRGVPAAVFGADMSRSINLGNLMWMTDERFDPTDVGSFKEKVFDTVGGPIASYAIRTLSEGARLLDEEWRTWPDFLEAAVPLKAYRAVSQGIRYNTQGIKSRGELEFVQPDEFKHMFQTLLGLQSTQKTESLDAYYSDELRKQRRSDRKSQLIRWADKAIRDNNTKELAKIMDDIESFNLSLTRSMEDRKYRITPGEMAALRSRRRTAQREYDKKYRYSN